MGWGNKGRKLVKFEKCEVSKDGGIDGVIDGGR